MMPVMVTRLALATIAMGIVERNSTTRIQVFRSKKYPYTSERNVSESKRTDAAAGLHYGELLIRQFQNIAFAQYRDGEHGERAIGELAGQNLQLERSRAVDHRGDRQHEKQQKERKRQLLQHHVPPRVHTTPMIVTTNDMRAVNNSAPKVAIRS